MTDHQRFKALLDELGLNYKTLAELLTMKHDSVKNQLAPAKPLPKWASMMLYVYERIKNRPPADQ